MKKQAMLNLSALAEVAGPLGDFSKKLSSPQKKEWKKAFKKFLRKENPWGKVKEKITPAQSLKLLILEEGGIQILKVPQFTVRDYFVQGKNGTTKICMSDRFKSVILDHASGQVSLESTSIDKLKFAKNMWDSEIRNELENPEPYSIDDALAIIKHLTSKQPKGQDGTLLNDGYANIFYVKAEDGRTVAVCAGCDSWRSEWRSEWRLRCWELGECARWYVGSCVFSPAAA